MFGIRYKTKCPFCGKVFTADHGITSYYHIKGRGECEYVRECCNHCGKVYFRACVNSDILLHKQNGDSIDIAIAEETEKQSASKKIFRNEPLTSAEIEQVKEQCNATYAFPEEDLFVDVDNVCEEDLKVVQVVCF